ncbi:MAG: 4Fe-4S binding protein [Sarcina sp.]|nr:4Fe-4S binding protein [Sarcina sp.]
MDNGNMNWRQRCRPGTRRLVQLYSALLYNAHLRGFIDGEIYVGRAKTVCVPGFNCYSCPGAIGACPLGSIQNALAAAGHQAGWYVLGIILLYGVILGRTICGWLCPLGLIQELLHKIPTPKIRKSRITRVLSWLKYILLAVFAVAIPLWYGLRHNMPLPGFCKYICPAGTFEGAIGLLANPVNSEKFSMLGILFTRKFIIMLLIGLLCVFCYRTFCRFICPLGAIYGLFNSFNVIGVKVDSSRCSGCGSCVCSCGMDVRHVGDHECINCGRCMEVCTRNAISIKAGSFTLKAPADKTDSLNRDQDINRKHVFRIIWSAALVFLCAALLWFNFLDPSVRKRSAAKPSVTPDEVMNEVSEREAENGISPAAEIPAEKAGVSFESRASVGYEIGQQLADFTTPTFDGGEFHLADTRGKIVFINFWGTYCTPCVQELPDFEALLHEHEEEVAVIAVHSSMTGEIEPQDYVKSKGWDKWTLPFALDDEEEDTIFTIANGGSTLPQTIVLNRRGEVVYNRVGSVTPEMLEALYKQADAETPAAP